MQIHYDTQARGEVKHTPPGKSLQHVGPARAIAMLEDPDGKTPGLSRGFSRREVRHHSRG
jgi:hypothetical protein